MITVKDLANDAEYSYSDSSSGNCQDYINTRIEALITTAMLENNMSSSINNPMYRDQYRSKITLGIRSAMIGNWCVSIR